jgi:perosamine synthetase
LDVSLIERQITPRTKAILPVHVFGRPANIDAILDIARRHDLRVIEDACEAIGARWRDQRVGSLGDVGVFAFYPNKQMTTGEGGMLVTNDRTLDQLFKSLRNQGRGETSAWLQHERLGFNYRLSDINCALGLAQLGRLESILRKRRDVAEEYRRQLSEIADLELPLYDLPDGEVSWFVYVVRVKARDRSGRDDVLRSLRADGIACGDYFSPLHLQPHIQRLGHQAGDFPVTEAVAASTIALPFYTNLQAEQIRRISEGLRHALARHPATSGASRSVGALTAQSLSRRKPQPI